ncbi:MAG: hypothetical protein KatS3mg005_1151 [Bryobacteraceae bacterium]|nr:MAG: hypothetical protein KatS3mg005_1151 [Bryobacteraceae bacterium]
MRAWFAVLILLPLAAQQAPEPPADPGRPVLKRGGAAQKREPVAEPEDRRPAQGAYREVVVDEQGRTEKVVEGEGEATRDDLLERAEAAASEFNEKLPSFICDQFVNRYESKTLKPQWKLQDRVQLELAYTKGKEEYRNIRINGKPLKKGSPEESGTWSIGEFGSTLVSIFASTQPQDFRLRGDSDAAGLKAKVYDFSVPKERSQWTIRYGYAVKPAHEGSLWIDPESARVLRIEMSSRRLPANYDIDKVEMTVDYDWVDIAGTRWLLPVRSENLACVRGTFTCMRNEIEFRNYRKFQVESQVLQVESEITFPEAEDDKPKPKTVPPSITPEPPKKKK